MFEKMTSSRKIFKKELRKHKRKLRQKFADDLAVKMTGNHRSTEFWKQIKRINSGSACTASPSIDGITCDQNLAIMWK